MQASRAGELSGALDAPQHVELYEREFEIGVCAAVALARRGAAGRAYSVAQWIAQLRAANGLSIAGDVDAALRLSDAIASAAEARGLRAILALALLVRSRAELRLGGAESAAEDGRRALELARDIGFHTRTYVLTSAVAQVITVLTECGQVDEALALLDSSGPAMGETEGAANPELLHATGSLRMRTGDVRAGVQDLLACGEILMASGIVNPAVATWRSQAAWGLTRLGDMGEARRLLDQELALARDWGAPGPATQALRVRAAMLMDFASTAQVLAEAVDLLRLAPERLRLTHTLYAHGRLIGKPRRQQPDSHIVRQAAASRPAMISHQMITAHIDGSKSWPFWYQALRASLPRSGRCSVRGIGV